MWSNSGAGTTEDTRVHLVKSDSLIERGLDAANYNIFEQNRIWARHASEKPDVAASLMRTIRAIHRRIKEERDLSALSIGAGNEPQFRILQSAFERGLWLYDIDGAALATLQERQTRQLLQNVHLVQGDYTFDFRDGNAARRTREALLDGCRQDLITLHHSLYYSNAATWPVLVKALYDEVLTPNGAIHAVMMSARETRPHTTTWLYNHFANRFFGTSTDQDLLGLRQQLREVHALKDCEICSETRQVQFWVDDFDLFMAVIWMILLYPHAHDYTLEQRIEITECVIENYWIPKRPLVQSQDYITIHKLGPAQSMAIFGGR